MISLLLAIAAGMAVIGVVGAARQENWGLFFLMPAIGGLAFAPVVAGLVIVTMMATEFASGQSIRSAYGAEPFWSAAIIAGMVLGAIFAVIAVVASRKPATTP